MARRADPRMRRLGVALASTALALANAQEPSIPSYALCSAHAGCPSLDTVACCPNAQGSFLPCCFNVTLEPVETPLPPTAECTAHATCPQLEGVACCPSRQGAFLPCCSEAVDPGSAISTTLTAATSTATAAAPSPPASTAALATTAAPSTPLTTGDFLATSVAPTVPTLPPPTTAALPTLATLPPLTTLPPPAPPVVVPVPLSTTIGPQGRFISAGKAVYWEDASGLLKHLVPPDLNCEECGCQAQVIAVIPSYVESLPEGALFDCGLIPGKTLVVNTPRPSAMTAPAQDVARPTAAPTRAPGPAGKAPEPDSAAAPKWPWVVLGLVAGSMLVFVGYVFGCVSPEQRRQARQERSLAPLVQDCPCGPGDGDSDSEEEWEEGEDTDAEDRAVSRPLLNVRE